ncbi:MAG: NUDIX domain-containing protein [Eubacteriales bacterium]|nr:NUDIX domain-containing protein [Eubacteriales bacterium]
MWDGTPGLWLQQRQLDRPLYPGWFDLASTGHIDPGETPEAGVLREAREEIGLALPEGSLAPAGSYRQRYARGEGGGFDDELAHAFAVRIDGVPPFSPGSEVAGMAFASLSAFARAHTEQAPLNARRADGAPLSIPHERLCCLHQEEWDGTYPTLAALLPPGGATT